MEEHIVHKNIRKFYKEIKRFSEPETLQSFALPLKTQKNSHHIETKSKP